MRLSLLYLMAFIIIASNAIAWAQDYNILAAEEERDKRAIDFGLFVRNLLLKSAAASNVKSDITRNVANLKATNITPRRRITTTTTTSTTTTVAPFFFNKGPFKFPFDLSAPFNNKLNSFNRGYINFDYNDYGGRQTERPARRRRPTTVTTTTRTTTTTTTPTPTRTPQPTKRRPIPRRPYGLFGKQKVPQFEYYNDDDYNYNYEDDDNDDAADTNSTTSAPPPPPPPAKPQRPPTAARARAQGRVPQLRNRFVYQFRQPEDTSTNNNAQPPATDSNTSTNSDDEDSQASNGNQNNTGNNNETSQNTNDDYTDDNASDNAANNAQDDYIDPNKTSDDNNSTPDDVNSNLPLPPTLQAQNQYNGRDYIANTGNFGPSANFQYPTYNDYGTHYQPYSPAGYSLSYY